MSGNSAPRRQICDGSGLAGVPHQTNPIYPSCSCCGREFSAAGRKANARLGNPWVSIPSHYVERSDA